jgi:hypothetical protein
MIAREADDKGAHIKERQCIAPLHGLWKELLHLPVRHLHGSKILAFGLFPKTIPACPYECSGWGLQQGGQSSCDSG